MRPATLLLWFSAALLPACVSLGEEPAWKGGRDRVYDLVHVELHLDLDPRRPEMEGRVRSTLRSLRDGLGIVPFDLVDLEVEGVEMPGVGPLEHRHREGRLEVLLDDPLARDQEIVLEVRYRGRPSKGLYWIGPDEAYPDKPWEIWSQSEMEDARHWWPTWDFPNDRTTSEVHVRAPRPFVAVSNGELVRVEDRGSDRTWVWRMEVPHVTYLTSVAVGAWEEESEAWEGVPLHYYVPPGRGDDIRRTFADTGDMMAYFSEITGLPYPYPRYNQVVVTDFIYGGMENIAATTLTEGTLHDARAHRDYPSTGLVAHELAHQWFGDLITCESWSHAWLNEGFATYLAALYIGRKEGREAFLLEMDDLRAGAVAADRGERRRPVVAHRYRDPFDLFDGHAYDKGAMVLHMLRDLLGDAGFFRALRHYTKTRAGTTVDTDDFIDAVEASEGTALGWFAAQWLHRPGQPDLETSWSWEPAARASEEGSVEDTPGGVLRLEIEQTQADEEEEPFRFPLTVRVYTEAEDGTRGSEDHRLQIGERRAVVRLPAVGRPRAVVLDPEMSLLATWATSRGREEEAWLLAHGANALVRRRAAEALADEGPAHLVVPALREALRGDPHHAVRAAAAGSLGRLGGVEPTQALVEALAEEEDSRARRAVATALGEAEDTPAVRAALRRALTRDDSYAVRAAAVRSLGKVRGEDAWPTLRRALRQDSHREVVRRAVFDAAADEHIAEALPVALARSRRGEPGRARSAAIAAVGRLGAEVEERRRRALAERLETILEHDPDLFARSAAARALGALGHEPSREALLRAESRDAQARVRRAARRAALRLSEEAGAARERGEVMRRLREVEEESGELRRELEELEDRLDHQADAPVEHKAVP